MVSVSQTQGIDVGLADWFPSNDVVVFMTVLLV